MKNKKRNKHDTCIQWNTIHQEKTMNFCYIKQHDESHRNKVEPKKPDMKEYTVL